MTESIEWPTKTREFHNHHFDSTVWNDLVFRDDDIVIATYAKAGTTWMQQIIGQLLFDGDADIEVAEMSPWIDLEGPAKGGQDTARRGPNSPTVRQDPPSGRRTQILTQGEVSLYWEGWT